MKVKFGGRFFTNTITVTFSHKDCRLLSSPVLLRKFSFGPERDVVLNSCISYLIYWLIAKYPTTYYSDLTLPVDVIRLDTWRVASWSLSRVRRVLMDLQKVVYGSQSQSRCTAETHKCTTVGSWWRPSSPIFLLGPGEECSLITVTKMWSSSESLKLFLSFTSARDANAWLSCQDTLKWMLPTDVGRRTASVKWRTLETTVHQVTSSQSICITSLDGEESTLVIQECC